ncbi:MAG: cytochrome-c peroxidase [bacterium]|nr:cytochrome-c peroxidase [bacterium]
MDYALDVEGASEGAIGALPLGLELAEAVTAEDNPTTRAKITLGRLLFFDKRLSVDDSVACASCHSPAAGFSDNLRVSFGIDRRQGERNAPTAINRFASSRQFWDGRAASLEEQATGPLINPLEMGMPDLGAVTRKIAAIEGYQELFHEVFAQPVSIDGIAKAIASFERALVSGNSRWDKFDAGIIDVLTIPERRGLGIFFGKGRCDQCHSGWNLTDEKFHNIGVGFDEEPIDSGRLVVTGKTRDTGAFKTPTLREITRTAPYMHDGRFETLEEVVDYYSEGVISNPFLDVEMLRSGGQLAKAIGLTGERSPPGGATPAPVAAATLDLTAREKADLVAFMGAFEGEGWQWAKAPDSFPQ